MLSRVLIGLATRGWPGNHVKLVALIGQDINSGTNYCFRVSAPAGAKTKNKQGRTKGNQTFHGDDGGRRRRGRATRREARERRQGETLCAWLCKALCHRGRRMNRWYEGDTDIGLVFIHVVTQSTSCSRITRTIYWRCTVWCIKGVHTNEKAGL
ncbi:uncharacterized protein MCYG_03019 [Microsporum canis CBS 113480]|uniref:Uncharacterized protein n=1 Tax=Arthroderma otae (strain ATCC MYA-4605 / CBS 113480) TaxID=554155 RepID=C5FKH8_ARTOC|nr:uncharacterized protein MCYG_03019 [Microsporum canis CBS 113480]EEQ30200.1 predicted protein [Microsporum canis CBS 113480]